MIRIELHNFRTGKFRLITAIGCPDAIRIRTLTSSMPFQSQKSQKTAKIFVMKISVFFSQLRGRFGY